jgi:hypothetical protein
VFAAVGADRRRPLGRCTLLGYPRVITQAGQVSTLLGGFEQVRGIAYDEAGQRLFVIDHSVTVGLPDKLRVIHLHAP